MYEVVGADATLGGKFFAIASYGAQKSLTSTPISEAEHYYLKANGEDVTTSRLKPDDYTESFLFTEVAEDAYMISAGSGGEVLFGYQASGIASIGFAGSEDDIKAKEVGIEVSEISYIWRLESIAGSTTTFHLKNDAGVYLYYSPDHDDWCGKPTRPNLSISLYENPELVGSEALKLAHTIEETMDFVYPVQGDVMTSTEIEEAFEEILGGGNYMATNYSEFIYLYENGTQDAYDTTRTLVRDGQGGFAQTATIVKGEETIAQEIYFEKPNDEGGYRYYYTTGNNADPSIGDTTQSAFAIEHYIYMDLDWATTYGVDPLKDQNPSLLTYDEENGHYVYRREAKERVTYFYGTSFRADLLETYRFIFKDGHLAYYVKHDYCRFLDSVVTGEAGARPSGVETISFYSFDGFDVQTIDFPAEMGN